MNPDKILFYEQQPIQRIAPECYQSVEMINKGYPPTLLCNFKDDKEMCVFTDRAQDTYYRMKFNVDSDSQLRAINSRTCNPCDRVKCSPMANNTDPLECHLSSRYKIGCAVRQQEQSSNPNHDPFS